MCFPSACSAIGCSVVKTRPPLPLVGKIEKGEYLAKKEEGGKMAAVAAEKKKENCEEKEIISQNERAKVPASMKR